MVTDTHSGWAACRLVVISLAYLAIVGSPVAYADEGVTPAAAPTSPEGCYCLGTVGNVNCDYRDEITLADVTMLIDHLFISGVRLPSLEEANCNGDLAGEITLADVSALIDHLYITGQSLPYCPGLYNNPPETQIVGLIEGVPFINSVTPVSGSTGVRLQWAAQDLIDHAYDDPDFTFEYRLFGPYTDAELALIESECVRPVFRTYDGRMFKRGDWNNLVICDTTWLPGGIREISCDTVITDTIEYASSLGWLDTLLDVDGSAFALFYMVADSSGNGINSWTYDTRDSLYNLFANHPTDTTLKANFIAWVRARDPLDSTVYDPTPAFRKIQVIEPKHERDILIIDWGVSSAENRAKQTSNRTYWNNAIQSWISNTPGLGNVAFSLASDWKHESYYNTFPAFPHKAEMILFDALRYKLILLLQDTPSSGLWSVQGGEVGSIYSAIQAGVSAWVVARVPFGGQSLQSPYQTYSASATYQYFFGVVQFTSPGWGAYLFSNPSQWGLPRVEDFVGATSLDPLSWPDMVIDTALLRIRYDWQGCVPSPECYTDPMCSPGDCFPFYPFSDDDFAFLGALPQVGWMIRSSDTEAMYTFKSLYGAVHPIDSRLSFEGRPVMIRLDRGIFRTAHSLFSPLAMEATSAQLMVDSMLSWLYEKWLPGAYVPPAGSDSEGRE